MTTPNDAAQAADVPEHVAHAMNAALCSFYMRWKSDGDYLRCAHCKRPQLASYAHLTFPHADGCPADCDEPHPWQTLLTILAPLATLRSPAAQQGGAVKPLRWDDYDDESMCEKGFHIGHTPEDCDDPDEPWCLVWSEGEPEYFRTREDAKADAYRQWSEFVTSNTETAASPTPSAVAALPGIPYSNDGKEQNAFESWAKDRGYVMHTHPLHWLFLDERTSAARDGWRSALEYVTAALTTQRQANECGFGDPDLDAMVNEYDSRAGDSKYAEPPQPSQPADPCPFCNADRPGHGLRVCCEDGAAGDWPGGPAYVAKPSQPEGREAVVIEDVHGQTLKIDGAWHHFRDVNWLYATPAAPQPSGDNQNAARYRWIREQVRRHGTMVAVQGLIWNNSSAKSFDEAVDKCMAKGADHD